MFINKIDLRSNFLTNIGFIQLSFVTGTVAEWTNASALKADGLIGPGVRIPPVPPLIFSIQVNEKSVKNSRL